VIGAAWRRLEKYRKDNLRWVTIIIGGVRWRAGDDPEVVAASVVDQVVDWRGQWRRAGNGGAWRALRWAGVVEVDVVRGDDDGAMGRYRSELLSDIGVDVSPLAADERIAVAHVHMVVGAADEAAMIRAREVMTRWWPGRRRIRVDPLWSSQTVSEALTALAGYCGKRRSQYSDGGWQGDVGSMVKFSDEWEDWVRYVVDRVYNELLAMRLDIMAK
jgi:hypothetical protein